MEKNKLQSDSMSKLSDVGKALCLYYTALQKEGLLPLLNEKRVGVENAVFDLGSAAAKIRFNRVAKEMGL